MSQPFTAIATLIAKPGQQDALERHLRALVEPTRAEAGCGQYDLHQDLANPLAFYMIEQWSSDRSPASPMTIARTSRTFAPRLLTFSSTSNSRACAPSPDSFFYNCCGALHESHRLLRVPADQRRKILQDIELA